MEPIIIHRQSLESDGITIINGVEIQGRSHRHRHTQVRDFNEHPENIFCSGSKAVGISRVSNVQRPGDDTQRCKINAHQSIDSNTTLNPMTIIATKANIHWAGRREDTGNTDCRTADGDRPSQEGGRKALERQRYRTEISLEMEALSRAGTSLILDGGDNLPVLRRPRGRISSARAAAAQIRGDSGRQRSSSPAPDTVTPAIPARDRRWMKQQRSGGRSNPGYGAALGCEVDDREEEAEGPRRQIRRGEPSRDLTRGAKNDADQGPRQRTGEACKGITDDPFAIAGSRGRRGA